MRKNRFIKHICCIIGTLSLSSCGNKLPWNENASPDSYPTENVVLKDDFKLYNAIDCVNTFSRELLFSSIACADVDVLYYFGNFNGYYLCYIDLYSLITKKAQGVYTLKEITNVDKIGNYEFKWWNENEVKTSWRPRLYNKTNCLTLGEAYKQNLLSNQNIDSIYKMWSKNKENQKIGIRFNHSFSKISKI